MNIYIEYFQTLKAYLSLLGIDKNTGLAGCSDEEIASLIREKGELPATYEAYLRTIGKKFLFDFMDAENMAYDHLGDINQFALKTFKRNSLEPESTFLVISERRYEYISLIHVGEDDPQVWIMSEFWDSSDGENLTIRNNSFTELINSFFRRCLSGYPASFGWVPEGEDRAAYIDMQFKAWEDGINGIAEQISSAGAGIHNPLVISLNQIFLEFYAVDVLNNSAGSGSPPTETEEGNELMNRFLNDLANLKDSHSVEKSFNWGLVAVAVIIVLLLIKLLM